MGTSIFSASTSGKVQTSMVKATPAQFHFHTHSEHIINGAEYPLEMHIVHFIKKDQLPACGDAGCPVVLGKLQVLVRPTLLLRIVSTLESTLRLSSARLMQFAHANNTFAINQHDDSSLQCRHLTLAVSCSNPDHRDIPSHSQNTLTEWHYFCRYHDGNH